MGNNNDYSNKTNIYILCGLVLCVFCGIFFLLGVFYQRSQDNVETKKEISAAKRLDAAADDSTKSVRGNVIKSESKKREEPIKQHFKNEQKNINALGDSIVFIEFTRMVARLKNKHR